MSLPDFNSSTSTDDSASSTTMNAKTRDQSAHTDPVIVDYSKWREGFLRTLLLITSILTLLAILNSLQSFTTFITVIYLALATLMLVLSFAKVPYWARAWFLLSGLFFAATVQLLNWGNLGEATLLYAITIVLATLIFDRLADFLLTALSALIIITVSYLTVTGNYVLSGWSPLPEDLYNTLFKNWSGWVSYTLDLLVLVAIVVIAVRLLKREFKIALQTATTALMDLAASRDQLEIRVAERTAELSTANQQTSRRAEQLQTITELSETISQFQDLSEIFPNATQLINQRFGFYHVGIFLLDDDGEYAILQATNSEGGQKMLARGHRLKLGTGVVGFAAQSGQPRIALDVGADAVYFNNPDLPMTRSEVALPMKSRSETIGVLDVQSTEPQAFSQEDLQVLTALANQVAIAIQNASSFEQAQRALRQAEFASSQLTGQAWKGYTENLQTLGYRYDGVKSEALKEAPGSRVDADSLYVPVQLRGQIIGRLKLKATDTNRQWTEDERAIIESTAERVAIAMEGARLLDEAQKRAARETFLSEIGAKLGVSFQLDSILRDTVEELGQTLTGSTVSFQLVNPSAPPKSEIPNKALERRKKSE